MESVLAADTSLSLMAQARRLKARRESGDVAATPSRKVEHRRQYAGRPADYFRDILGWTLTDQILRALEIIESHDRVLLPGGNNIGKTHLLGCYGIYRLDAVAALADTERGLQEQGAQILLPGPDASTVFSTIYNAMLENARRAESRGHAMPGTRSEASVNWRVRPRWFVEAFHPPRDAKREQSHTASGRHHRNQVALIEEALGITDALLRAAEGMCSGTGNKIICSFNPTEPAGAIYQRLKRGDYAVLHLSAMDHPNVRSRTHVIPEAIDYRTVDTRVRSECLDIGPAGTTLPESSLDEFVYALPPPGAEETGPRTDGIPGHPLGEPRIYRPSPIVVSQVFGAYPRTSATGLFDVASIDAAVQRWKSRPRPPSPVPDVVGFDVAREGGDDSVGCPRWGESAEVLLRAYHEAREAEMTRVGPVEPSTPSPLAELLKSRRCYIGEPVTFQRGDGHAVALQAVQRFGRAPWNVDEGGGASVIDQGRHVHGIDVNGVSFGSGAPDPVPGEGYCLNMRTAMYVRAGMMLRCGLVDLPPSERLREELLAHWLIIKPGGKTAEYYDPKHGPVKRRVDVVALVAKEEIAKRIGRSPDEADAFVLSLVGGRRRSIGITF